MRFDCFGDFQGFTLETCSGRRHFGSREIGVERLVLRACRERLTIEVCLGDVGEGIAEIIVRA